MKNTNVKVISEEAMKKNIVQVVQAAQVLKYGPMASAKDLFLTASRNYLKATLALMGVEGEVRVNKGGPAVSGEVILHTDKVYCQFSVSPFVFGNDYYYRKCKSRTDYTGGPNYWGNYNILVEYPKRFGESLKLI